MSPSWLVADDILVFFEYLLEFFALLCGQLRVDYRGAIPSSSGVQRTTSSSISLSASSATSPARKATAQGECHCRSMLTWNILFFLWRSVIFTSYVTGLIWRVIGYGPLQLASNLLVLVGRSTKTVPGLKFFPADMAITPFEWLGRSPGFRAQRHEVAPVAPGL